MRRTAIRIAALALAGVAAAPRAPLPTIVDLPRAAAALTQASSDAVDDPFAAFRPTVVVTDAERRRLAQGEAVARVAPASGREVTVFAAVAVAITPARLVAWTRRIERLKQNRFTQAIGRFSDPPRPEDLAALTLDPADVAALRRCRPGDCAVKLPADDLLSLRREALAPAAGPGAIDRAFRRTVLRRTETYLEGGLDALPPLVDRREPVSPAARFAGLLERTAFLSRALPDLARALGGAARPSAHGFEHFLYWSKEVFGGKPVVAVTDVTIARHDDGLRPDVVIAGKGVLATHYVTASLGVTSLVTDRRSGERLLVYVNRSELDVLDGMFGGVVRRVIERRLRSEAAGVLRDLKARLESGDPPDAAPAANRGPDQADDGVDGSAGPSRLTASSNSRAIAAGSPLPNLRGTPK
jgi:hypothetical protein